MVLMMKYAISIPCEQTRIHLQDGSYVTQNYGKEGGGNLFTFRGILNRKMNLAEKEGNSFF
jgi:kynurenine 3-monooxygenase